MLGLVVARSFGLMVVLTLLAACYLLLLILTLARCLVARVNYLGYGQTEAGLAAGCGLRAV